MEITLQRIDGVGVLREDETLSNAGYELHDLLELHDAGCLGHAAYCRALRDLLRRFPLLIDGHAHLGHELIAAGKYRAGLAACRAGVAIGEAVIPADFTGEIPGIEAPNRPFLRALQGVALAHRRLGAHAAAARAMERLLVLDPSDAREMRYLVGGQHLRLGDTARARFRLSAWADQYPPCRYDLALLLFQEGRLVEAATELRRGFLENPYIAAMLAGDPDPRALQIWHLPAYAERDTADDYIVADGALWYETPDAMFFLRWLHGFPGVLTERGQYFACCEELLWERDFDRRGTLLASAQDVKAAIDEDSSRYILRPRMDREGRTYIPWLDMGDAFLD